LNYWSNIIYLILGRAPFDGKFDEEIIKISEKENIILNIKIYDSSKKFKI